MKVKLVHITNNAEQLIGDIARVSTGKSGEKFKGLFKYLLAHDHISPFEMCSMCIQIECSRAIGRQILRHRSFSFQEFSQRYAEVIEFEDVHPRREHEKNRQSSVDDLPSNMVSWFQDIKEEVERVSMMHYKALIQDGISRESARFLLPESAMTKMYMHGTIRSFIHYVDLRIKEDTQEEHREIAREIQDIMYKELPTISETMWGEKTKE